MGTVRHRTIEPTREKVRNRRPQPASPAPAGAVLQRAQVDPGSLTAPDLIALQRAVGNRAVGRLLAGRAAPSAAIQAKLTVGAPGDKYEQEADRAADQVLRMPDPEARLLQRHEGEEESRDHVQLAPLQRAVRLQSTPDEARAPDGSFEAGAGFESRLAATRGAGHPLPQAARDYMEPRFGADFGGVRVHADGAARQLNRQISAQAFTRGSDIYFGAGKYNPASTAGQRLLAHELAHVVQQGGAPVQRHPSHAEEEEVQAKPVGETLTPLVQLHPSHAQEEEVQAKAVGAALSRPAEAVAGQRRLVGQRTGPGRVQRGLISWIKKRWKGVGAREQELSRKYGIRIGPDQPDGTHFSHAVLDKLEKVLDRIPIQHIRDTYLQNISRGDGIGAASAYTQDTGASGHIGIVQPPLGPFGEMPGWLYTMLSKGVGWQRRMMDEGAIGSLAPNVTQQADQDLGLANNQRQVFAGVSDVLARGNLVEWTIRHEMGHAVDHKIQWTARRAKLSQFGGWKQYDETNQAEMNELATRLLEKAGIDYPNHAVQLNRVQNETVTPLEAFVPILQPGGNARSFTAYQKQLMTQRDPAFEQKWQNAGKVAGIAKAQPWMFPDGGAQHLEHNGRIYHLDHYDTWVSYLANARTGHGLSNYQFSSPGEWFAEAYAAYYDPDPNSAARARLSDATRNWFQKNLGDAPRPGQPAPVAPALAVPPAPDSIKGDLRPLAELGPELLAELQGGDRADIGDVPEDLRQDGATRLGGF